MAGEIWLSRRRVRKFAASSGQSAFLKREELQDSTALGIFAVRATSVGEHPVYVVGGRRLDKNFLSGLDLPADMRVLLYQNRSDHFSPASLLDPSAAEFQVPRGLQKT